MFEQAIVDSLLAWILQNPLATVLIIVTSLILVGLLLGTWSKRRRSHTLLTAFAGSVHGPPKFLQRANRRGFAVETQSQPDPFVNLIFRHKAVSYLDPIDLLTLIRKGIFDQIIVEATLLHPPSAELLWQRHHIPRRALGRPDDVGLWRRHELDIISSEYVVRGTNTKAIEHSLLEFQNRFGPFMQRMAIQANNGPHIEIVLYSGRFNANEVPALLHLVQGAGRASQLR